MAGEHHQLNFGKYEGEGRKPHHSRLPDRD